jgi:hypothetical protein
MDLQEMIVACNVLSLPETTRFVAALLKVLAILQLAFANVFPDFTELLAISLAHHPLLRFQLLLQLPILAMVTELAL